LPSVSVTWPEIIAVCAEEINGKSSNAAKSESRKSRITRQ
jgi:hypothetical protein